MRLNKVIDKLLLLMHHPRTNSIVMGDEMHTCANCGHEYQGNFCPACGQKATAGRITWNTVRRGVMDVWGLGSRSIFRSLWNLIVRPGNFINDYINGKWQVSFPPVKMLVIVAVILFFIGRLVYPEYWSDLFGEETEITSSGVEGLIDTVFNWMMSHNEWTLLFLLSSLIIPTWFVYRHAPRNTCHTLPQGFFIQVFLSIQFCMWLFISSLVFRLCGLGLDLSMTIAFTVILPLLVFVDYKSLFGYGWWGTLWRIIVTVLLAYLGLMLLIFLSVIYNRLLLSSGELRIVLLLIRFLCVVTFVMTLIFVIDMINRMSWRTAGWLSAKYPLISLGVLLGLLVVGEIMRPGTLAKIVELMFLN